MKLESIKVVGFKRIKSLDLALADVNILVGVNGCGKSSFLQATHFAACIIRQAGRVDKGSTVSIEELDYLPTNAYKKLSHKGEWGNKAGSPSSKISFKFSDAAGAFTAECELRSARNAGITISGSVPVELTDTLRKKLKFFSTYIPGISGIPNKEEKKSKKVVLKSCSFGDSNIILRNVLLLLCEQNKDNLTRIQNWIKKTADIDLIIDVHHEDEKDLTIDCWITFGNDSRPLELVGAGHLQLIQIFAYALLFRPGALLIDEPDIHLHPSVQERLCAVLSEMAQELNMRVIMTTHSPFVLRGAPINSNVYWIKDGSIESTERKTVELALGWGAFGKKVIIISEDSETAFLKKIVSQWENLARHVTFFPTTGYKSLPSSKQASEIAASLGNKFQILVHRDRDSLTDEEASALQKEYSAEGITLWLPEQSDIEAYFCDSSYISDLSGCTQFEAQSYIDTVLQKNSVPIYDQFEKQRAAHNEKLHPKGGSPTNEDVWKAFQVRGLKGAKGKYVFNQLKNQIPGSKFSPESVLSHAAKIELAPTLRLTLETAVVK